VISAVGESKECKSMKARETTYTETLSIVGNYMTRERSGFADIPVIVSVVAFTALAGLVVSAFCLVRGIIAFSKEVMAFVMWAQQKIEKSNRARVRSGASNRPNTSRPMSRTRKPKQLKKPDPRANPNSDT
jgi:hypothetical protein